LNPGPFPKSAVERFFSGVFPWFAFPGGKSNIDAVKSVTDALPVQDPVVLDLTELRAPLALEIMIGYLKCFASLLASVESS